MSSWNGIYILADAVGYGDLSYYGQQGVRTPHVDRMAAEGLRFTFEKEHAAIT